MKIITPTRTITQGMVIPMHDGIYTLMGHQPLCEKNTAASAHSPLRRLCFVGAAIVLGITLFCMTISGFCRPKKIL